MSVTKEQVMLALNLDESDDVALIQAYITTAETYIKNAVGNADERRPFVAGSVVAKQIYSAPTLLR